MTCANHYFCDYPENVVENHHHHLLTFCIITKQLACISPCCGIVLFTSLVLVHTTEQLLLVCSCNKTIQSRQQTSRFAFFVSLVCYACILRCFVCEASCVLSWEKRQKATMTHEILLQSACFFCTSTLVPTYIIIHTFAR